MKDTLSYASYKKSPYRSIKLSTYFETYDDLFARYRGKDITFVEIGILGGGSLFMWRDFFGDNARIIGIDLNPGAKKWEAEGFEIFIGSQSDEKFWKEVVAKVGPMDVVLDDGGHTYEQQVITTESLIDNIADGGMLVVEDTHTSYMPGFGKRKYSFIEYVKNTIDRVNKRFSKLDHDRADHRVWSIQIYESLVAFHVNRKASNLVSEVVDNGGKKDEAIDYRHSGNPAYKVLSRYYRSSNFLKSLPGIKPIARTALNLVTQSKASGNISRFFR